MSGAAVALYLSIFLFLITCMAKAFSTSMYKIARKIDGDSLAGGRGVSMVPNSGKYSKILLWFHGLGDEADGWSELMPNLDLEDTKFVLPTAPLRPITLNGGFKMTGWSDIIGLDLDSPEDKAGFDASVERIDNIIKYEIETNGISTNNIAIGGFSQGGALALHYSLRTTHSLNSCVALSTWVPMGGEYPNAMSSSAKTIPIMQVHGEADQVVSFKWGTASHELLKTMITSPVPQFMSIKSMGHSSDPAEIRRVREFLKEHLKA